MSKRKRLKSAGDRNSLNVSLSLTEIGKSKKRTKSEKPPKWRDNKSDNAVKFNISDDTDSVVINKEGKGKLKRRISEDSIRSDYEPAKLVIKKASDERSIVVKKRMFRKRSISGGMIPTQISESLKFNEGDNEISIMEKRQDEQVDKTKKRRSFKKSDSDVLRTSNGFLAAAELEVNIWNIFDIPMNQRTDILSFMQKVKHQLDENQNKISHMKSMVKSKSRKNLNRELVKSDRDTYDSLQLKDSERIMNDLSSHFLDSDVQIDKGKFRLSNWKTPSGNPIYKLSKYKSNQDVVDQIFKFHDLHHMIFVFDREYPKTSSLFTIEDDHVRVNKGTTEELIDLLFLPRSSPIMKIFNYNQFLSDFLNTYPLIIKDRELLKYIVQRYASIEIDVSGYHYQFKRAVLNMIHEWVHLDNGYHFKTGLNKKLSKFLLFEDDEEFIQAYTNKTRKILNTLRTIEPELKISIITEHEYIKFTDFDLSFIVEQLTAIEYYMFKTIPISEFVDVVWSSGKRISQESSQIMEMIKFSNRLASLVVTEILRCGSEKTAMETICYFINMLQKLRNINNFNSLFSIIGGLHNVSVAHLKKAWILVPKKEMEIFKRLTDLMSSLKHYKEYQDELNEIPSSQFCIPALSVVCENIQKLDEVVELYDGDLVNWDKLEKMSHIILNFRRFEGKFESQIDPAVKAFICQYEIWEEDQCWEVCALRTTPSEKPYALTSDLWNSLVINERDWRFMMTGCTRSTYQQNDIILEKGIQNDALHRVTLGKVRADMITENGVVTKYFTKGNSFGEDGCLGILEETRFAYSAYTDFVEINSISVTKLIDNCNPEIDQINKILFYAVKKKAKMLLHLIDIYYSEQDEIDRENSLGSYSSFGNLARNELDETFSKKFSISDYEVVVRSVPCQFKSGSTHTGQLFISQNYICFCSTKNFGFKHKETIPKRKVSGIVRKNETIIILIQNSQDIFQISNLENIEDILKVLKLISSHENYELESEMEKRLSLMFEDEQIEIFTAEFWDYILKGSRVIEYEMGDLIFPQGSNQRTLYKLQSGSCVVEQNSTLLFDFISPDGGLFGEILFLGKGPVPYSVRASSPIAKVYIIEPSYLHILFQYYPNMAKKLYLYLGLSITEKMNAIERQNTLSLPTIKEE